MRYSKIIDIRSSDWPGLDHSLNALKFLSMSSFNGLREGAITQKINITLFNLY